MGGPRTNSSLAEDLLVELDRTGPVPLHRQIEASIRAGIRASPVVHADETGWRENGRNGYATATPGPSAPPLSAISCAARGRRPRWRRP